MDDDQPEVWRGHEALRPHLIPIDALTADPENARLHPDRNLDTIKRSLERFGQTYPILHRGGMIVAGHGRAQAAVALGWTHLAGLAVDDLSPEEAKALALIDNKSGELAEWNFEALGMLLRALPPELLDFTGFADFERMPLLQAEWKPKPVSPEGSGTGGATAAMESISLTRDQFEIVERAVNKIREAEGDASMTFGRALELLCADWMS